MDRKLELAIEKEIEAQRERTRELVEQSEVPNFDEEMLNAEEDPELEDEVYFLKG